MHNFDYFTILSCGVHLNYEQIHENFAFYSDWADQVTDGDRCLWCLYWAGNTLAIGFKRKRDKDLFAQVIRNCTFITSTPVGGQNRCVVHPTRPEKRTLKNNEFSYKLEYDYVEPELVGELGADASQVADQVTRGDRSSYDVWFYNNVMLVGFEQEDDQVEFAKICDDEATANEDVFGDPPPSMNAQMQAITAH